VTNTKRLDAAAWLTIAPLLEPLLRTDDLDDGEDDEEEDDASESSPFPAKERKPDRY
jgi:hypothetical protein